MFIKRIKDNIFAIFGIAILILLIATKIPFFKIQPDIGYSLGLLLSMAINISKAFIIIITLQILIVLLLVTIFSKIGAKIVSILSMLISLGLINVLVFINFSNTIDYVSSYGFWLSLLAFILIGINYFINFSDVVKCKINNSLKEKKEMKDILFNSPKKLVAFSFVATIISAICSILVILFSGAIVEMSYIIVLLVVNGFIGYFIYFYYLKYRMGKFNIKSLNIMIFVQSCITFIYKLLDLDYLFLPLLFILIYYFIIFFSKKVKSIKSLTYLYRIILITYMIVLVYNVSIQLINYHYGYTFVNIISTIAMLYMIPIIRYMYLYGKSIIERRMKSE
ncbi:MAG: hypothetical protein PHD02_00040 [Bacilli bacterium]|nr:hypothetical protein [Bacilli bacterium]